MIRIHVSTKKEGREIYDLLESNKELKEYIANAVYTVTDYPLPTSIIEVDKDMCEMCGSDNTNQNLHNFDEENPDYPGGPVFKCYDCQYEVIREDE